MASAPGGSLFPTPLVPASFPAGPLPAGHRGSFPARSRLVPGRHAAGNRQISDPAQDLAMTETPGSAGPAPRTAAQRLGDAAEATIAEHLAAAGWTLLGRNLRFGRSEVDLLGLDPGPPAALVLVEVRWRASRAFGVAEETFDWRKRGH